MGTHFKIGDIVHFLDYGRANKGEVMGVTFTKYDPSDSRIISNLYVEESFKRSMGHNAEIYAVYCEQRIQYLEYNLLFDSKENLIRHILGEI